MSKIKILFVCHGSRWSDMWKILILKCFRVVNNAFYDIFMTNEESSISISIVELIFEALLALNQSFLKMDSQMVKQEGVIKNKIKVGCIYPRISI